MSVSGVLIAPPVTQTTSASTALALVLVAVALLLVPTRPRIEAAAAGRPLLRRRGSSPSSFSAPWRRGAVGGAAVAAAGVVLLPGLWWVILPVSVIVGVLLARLPVGPTTAQRTADRRLVAVHAELLASCLDAGMAVGPALRAVSDVLADPSSRAGPDRSGGAGPLATLDAVAAMLSLGADPGTAWRVADLDPNLAPLAAAARRSAVGGGGLAQAVREHAAQLRHETAAASVRAAGRAGVLMTAPLGVCFLPAFLCLGLAPVVVGLLGQLDIF